MVAIIVRMPEGLKKQFKAICSIKGESMNGVILKMILDYVKKHK